MGLIKNYEQLIKAPERKSVLDVVEAGLVAIQPQVVVSGQVRLVEDKLWVQDMGIELKRFERVRVVGFGKGAAMVGVELEKTLGDRLTEGWVIDVVEGRFKKMSSYVGTHPIVSDANIKFTTGVLDNLKDVNDKDLIIVIVAGGGSALFDDPAIPLTDLVKINQVLLESGATIQEMNIVRRHLSRIKGGGLAVRLQPATVVGLVFSDVPGNDLKVVASGPTVVDETTVEMAWGVATKYLLNSLTGVKQDDFVETAKQLPGTVVNKLILSNRLAIAAMQKEAQRQGIKVRVVSDQLIGEAREVGVKLLGEAIAGEMLIAGGETTVTVKGNGKGGRNREVVLGALAQGDMQGVTLVSVASDGWDNGEAAGAIGDGKTLGAAANLAISPQKFLDDNNSEEFFNRIGDRIEMGRLSANVADLMVAFKV